MKRLDILRGLAGLVALVNTTACCRLEHVKATTIVAEVAFATLSTVDALQSQNAFDTCIESNPLIGNCGERARFYFPLAIVGHAAAAIWMPRKYLAWFEGFTIGAELDQVYENHALGYHVDGTYTGRP